MVVRVFGPVIQRMGSSQTCHVCMLQDVTSSRMTKVVWFFFFFFVFEGGWETLPLSRQTSVVGLDQ